MRTILIFGAGFSGKAIGRLEAKSGAQIIGTTRSNAGAASLEALGMSPIIFDGLGPSDTLIDAIQAADEIIVSIAPGDAGDPVLNAVKDHLLEANQIKWIAYLSTVGVYGNHDGAWVDEDTHCKPVSKRSIQRVAAETAWLELAKSKQVPLSILRLSGIYGPGRNALKNMVEGKARRLVKPGQVFNRIHVADIARSVAFLSKNQTNGIFNVTDNMPSPPQDVVEYAASVTKIDPPEPIAFETATLSPMARSFYGENKRVSNAKIKSMGFQFSYPDYRYALAKMWTDDDWR